MNMKNLTILAAGLLATASVFASPVTVSRATSVDVGTFQSKAAAYDAGFALADSLQAMNNAELGEQLDVATYAPASNIKIAGRQVQVEEIANSRNDIQYRAVVNVDYRFKTIESN